MTKYFCDRCGKQIPHELEIQCVTFRLEAGKAYDEPTAIQHHTELCLECLSKTIKDFNKLINNM